LQARKPAVARRVDLVMATLTPSRPAARDLAHGDVVMALGYTSWTGAAGRGRVHAEDRLTLELIDSPRVSRLLVGNPFRSAPIRALRRATGSAAEPFPSSETRHLHEPLRLRRSDPTRERSIEKACRRYEDSLRTAAARHGLRDPAVITTHPLLAGFGDFGWAGPVTYYANDDLSACPPLRPWWPAFETAYARMRSRERRAVALTTNALRRIDPSGPAAVIPCGIEPDEWRRPASAPRWFRELPGPRMIYVGSLDERIDGDAVRVLAAANPEGSIVLVGQGAERGPMKALGTLPNVHLHPAVDRAELTALVAAADLGLIPHVRSEQTEAMSPLKLYEYLAAGIPVAATDLPGIDGVSPDRVRLAGTTSEFGAAAISALALGRWSEPARAEFAAANSWSRRFSDLLDLALAPNPSPGRPSTSSRGL
jgi:teichuronic acid biosynthesis glycosyltransferase TuaH